MRGIASRGAVAALFLGLAGCGENTSEPGPSQPPDATSLTVEVVDLTTSEIAAGPLVSFRREVGSRDQDVLVPVTADVLGPREAAAKVAVLQVPFGVTGGGEAPRQVLGRVPAGETLLLEDGAVVVADGVTAVRICVDVLIPVPPEAGPPDDDGVVQFFAREGPTANTSVCSPDERIAN